MFVLCVYPLFVDMIGGKLPVQVMNEAWNTASLKWAAQLNARPSKAQIRSLFHGPSVPIPEDPCT